MFEIDPKSRKTISEQILDNMRELILTGVLKEEEKLPSVREMAKMLTVNPNTVQKAYKTLEGQGYIYTTKGRGTFVSDTTALSPGKKEVREAMQVLEDAINSLFLLGLDKAEVEKMIEKIINDRREWT